MKRITFTNLGYKWERINRKEARRRYNNGEALMVCPSTLRPGYPWHPETYVCSTPSEPKIFETMEAFENAYRYYCTGTKNGYIMYFKNGGML